MYLSRVKAEIVQQRDVLSINLVAMYEYDHKIVQQKHRCYRKCLNADPLVAAISFIYFVLKSCCFYCKPPIVSHNHILGQGKAG